MSASNDKPSIADRLADLRADADPTGVGRLVRCAATIDQASAGARQLVKWRIRKTLQRRGWGPAVLRPTLVVALVFVSGGFLGATIHRMALRVAVGQPHGAHRPAREPAARSAARAPIATPAPSLRGTPPPSVWPTGNTPPERKAPVGLRSWAAAAGARAATVGAPSAPATSPATPSSGEAAQQALLARAIRQLRIEGSPDVALASLEDYQARFPASALEPEAEALRVEALLALGRRTQALAGVDELLARPRPGNDGRRVLRGEIRMSLGAWRDALTDFEVALAGDGGAESGRSTAGFVERALWGRAVSRGRLGDESGARAALEDYLRRFPQGRFAAGAARALGQRP